MKRILTGLLFGALLTGCSKQMDVNNNSNAPQQLVMKNQYISIVNVSARQSAARQVTFTFSTEYEKDLNSIELLGGADQTLFCQIYIEYKGENSNGRKTYTVVDNDPKGTTPHYMVKYNTTNGAWYGSTVYKVDMK